MSKSCKEFAAWSCSFFQAQKDEATNQCVSNGLFALVVWVPIVAAGGISDFQWGEFVVTCALTAAARVVADSCRGIPWLAVGRRKAN